MTAITGLNAGEVHGALQGHVWAAPVGTAAPTGAVAALNASFLDLGYLDDSGVKFSPSNSYTSITSWQSGVPVLELPKSSSFTAKFVLLQLNAATVAAYTGATVTVGSPSTEYTYSVSTAVPSIINSWIFDALSQDGYHYRYYIPRGQVTAQDDLTLSRSAAMTYGMTVTALAPLTGSNFYEVFTDDPNFTS